MSGHLRIPIYQSLRHDGILSNCQTSQFSDTKPILCDFEEELSRSTCGLNQSTIDDDDWQRVKAGEIEFGKDKNLKDHTSNSGIINMFDFQYQYESQDFIIMK